jgi:uncharacterized protein YjbI with pentapeptide repeats
MRSVAVFSWLFLIPINYSLFLISICVFGVSAQCLGNQQSLLLQLKNNLTFDPAMSNKLVKWNQSVDCCFWEGVTCHEGCVIGLDLASESIWCGLDDSSSLFSLQDLQSLSLAYNDFNSSQIPSQFDKLENLSYLNLSNAGFAGQIPIAISRLIRLVTLDLSGNYYPWPKTSHSLTLGNPNLNMLLQNLSELVELHLDDVIISAQGKKWCHTLSSLLPNLRVLSLSYCNLSGPLDSSLRNLKSLSIIRLNGNNFSSPIPIFFSDFKNLTSLEVSFSGLNGKFPKKIFQVPTLQTIDLSYNNDLQGSLPEFPPNGSLRTIVLKSTYFSGTLPHSIGNLRMLSSIDLSNCDFSGSIPVFSMAKNLTYLDLSSNNLIGQITSTQWEELLKLEYIFLDGNSLNGNIPVSLFSIPSLRVFGLSSNQFSGQLKEFSNVSSYILEQIYLDNNRLEGPIPMSIFELRRLEALSLGSNKFNNSLDTSVIQPLKNLFYLDLSHINLLTEYNGLNISLYSVQLRTLILASCKLKKFPDFLRNQSNLSFLDLSNNQIYGELPTTISQSLAFTRYLSLSSNKFYGSIPGSICNATYLEFIDLSNNSFSGTTLQGLIEMSGKLRVLNLKKNKLNGTNLDAFPDNCGLQT